MGSVIDRTAKTALDTNLVNGVTSDAPKVKANNDILYNYVDGLNAQDSAHAEAATLAHPDQSVTTAKIKDGSITTAKYAPQSITTDKLSPDLQNSTNLEVVNARGTFSTLKGRLDDSDVKLADIVHVRPTDTKTKIQSIINANRNVKFMAGNYSFSAITIPESSKIEFDANVLITSDNLNDFIFKVTGNDVVIRGNNTKIDLNDNAVFAFQLIGTAENKYQNFIISGGFEIYNHPSFVTAHMAPIYVYYVDQVNIRDIYVHDYGTDPSQSTPSTLVYAFITGNCNDVVIQCVKTKNVCISYCSTNSENIVLENFTFIETINNVIYLLEPHNDISIEKGFIDGGSQGITIEGSNVKVSHMTIRNCFLAGIMLRHATNILISKCEFTGCYYDVFDETLSDSDFVKINDCISNGATSGNSIQIRRANDWEITNCTFKEVNSSNGGCIYLYAAPSNSRLRRIHVKECSFFGKATDILPTTNGISLRVADSDAIQYCTFTNNKFYDLPKAFSEYVTGVSIGGVNNYFIDNTYFNVTTPSGGISANNVIKRYGNQGSYTTSGNGSSTTVIIPHGLSGTPSYHIVQEASAAAGVAEISYVTADATNLTVTFKTAPASGSNNVVLKWRAE